jgi:hypothetical protein
MLYGTPVGAVAPTIPGGQTWFGLAYDDLRLVGLKPMFLAVIRVASVLGLWRQETWWKDAEILMLRRQLVVALRERPCVHSRLTWPDRAWLALLAGTLPAGRPAAMRFAPAAPRPGPGRATAALPDGVTDLDHFRVRRHDRAGGVIHEYRLVA